MSADDKASFENGNAAGPHLGVLGIFDKDDRF